MSNEIYYGSRSLNGADGAVLDYYLIRESIGEGYCDLTRCGVKIVKTETLGGGGKTVEAKQINNIFYREEDADEFLKLIMRNRVTPVSLTDVVEDYIIDTVRKTA